MKITSVFILIALLLVGIAAAERTGTAGDAKEREIRDYSQIQSDNGMETVDLTTGLTAADLANQLLGSGINVSNVRYTGADLAAGTFTGGTGIIGFEEGIILSTGRINHVIGPNLLSDISWQNNMPGDDDLDEILRRYSSNEPIQMMEWPEQEFEFNRTYDAAILEFNFVPQGNVVQFEYVFSSDEYNEFVGSQFNDVFGFFLNGENIAIIPGTADTPVAINYVNLLRNPGYYRNNDLHDGMNPPAVVINTEMDGLTTVLTATGQVNRGVTNTIKIAIADVGDDIYDSNVFIRATSFEASSPELTPLQTIREVGETQTLTATLIDTQGDPIADETITFMIVSGPNEGETGTGVTNASGNAVWSYSSETGLGTDKIIATYGDLVSNSAYTTWIDYFDVTFIVTDEDEAPLQGAVVTIGDEEKTTGPAGTAVFTVTNGWHDYIVTKEGYGPDQYGTVTVVDENVEVPVMLMTFYQVTFIVTNEEHEPLEGAGAVLSSEPWTIKQTDSSGEVVFQTYPGNHTYQIIKEGYGYAFGMIEVINEDITKTVVLRSDHTGIAIWVMPGQSALAVGETREYSILLTGLSEPNIAFNIDINITQPERARITGVNITLPGEENGHTPVPAESVTCWGTYTPPEFDFFPQEVGGTLLVMVSVEALSEGTTNLTVSRAEINSEIITAVTPAVIRIGDDAAPVANFIATPTTGPAPLAVAFTDISTGAPTSWAWDFGDGSSALIQNPTHTYTAPGTYTVNLTVTNSLGSDSEEKIGYITVLESHHIQGDLNRNGRIDIGDVANVAWMAAGLTPEDLEADFNDNGQVDSGDAARIAYFYVGKTQEI
ncbi:choice-of-anchor L domain-containing protein [Methanocalculus chunghsingensis]|uniref:choice-of-anchor L domain-containing protein n=1 Tax=Methanocalculus chunghsingensis TaxID=156457 RepID=UPI001B8B386A|nr:choice-of-anchor L domain-containing protein [Methanocalculus chunghsingensis]